MLNSTIVTYLDAISWLQAYYSFILKSKTTVRQITKRLMASMFSKPLAALEVVFEVFLCGLGANVAGPCPPCWPFADTWTAKRGRTVYYLKTQVKELYTFGTVKPYQQL